MPTNRNNILSDTAGISATITTWKRYKNDSKHFGKYNKHTYLVHCQSTICAIFRSFRNHIHFFSKKKNQNFIAIVCRCVTYSQKFLGFCLFCFLCVFVNHFLTYAWRFSQFYHERRYHIDGFNVDYLML
jgi:hypothetical protein